MYNSYILTIFQGIWSNTNKFYEYSFSKVIVNKLIMLIATIASTSKVIDFFKNDNSFIKYSIFYGLYSKCIEMLEKMFSSTRCYINKYKDTSMTNHLSKELFGNIDKTFISISTFITSFFISVVTIYVISGQWANISSKIIPIIILFLIISIINSKDKAVYFKNSFVINNIRRIFIIENEENEKWK